jgi:hypothetical protein
MRQQQRHVCSVRTFVSSIVYDVLCTEPYLAQLVPNNAWACQEQLVVTTVHGRAERGAGGSIPDDVVEWTRITATQCRQFSCVHRLQPPSVREFEGALGSDRNRMGTCMARSGLRPA